MAAQPGFLTLRTIRRQGVAADVSRRILSSTKMAPTDVGGYTGKSPG
jgi:hypothetical protein